jgi:hypothetical protein
LALDLEDLLEVLGVALLFVDLLDDALHLLQGGLGLGVVGVLLRRVLEQLLPFPKNITRHTTHDTRHTTRNENSVLGPPTKKRSGGSTRRRRGYLQMRWMGLMRNALKERLRVAGFSAHS